MADEFIVDMMQQWADAGENLTVMLHHNISLLVATAGYIKSVVKISSAVSTELIANSKSDTSLSTAARGTSIE